MKTFVTGNQFFGRKGAIRKYDRPFANTEEMDDHMVKMWNSVVADNDFVFVLGNFIWDPLTADSLMKKLNGFICLIQGESDNASIDVVSLHPKKLKILESDIHIDNEHNIAMSHWPMGEWPLKSKGFTSVISYHGSKYRSDHTLPRINVCCDYWSFTPVEIGKVLGLFDEI